MRAVADLRINKVNSQISATQSETQKIEKSFKQMTDSSVKELKKLKSALEKALNSGEVKRNSEAWNELQEKLRAVKQELQSISEESKVASDGKGIMGWMENVTKIWGALDIGLRSISGLSMTIRKTVKDFADIDAEMANVRKFTGMTADEVARLNEEFKEMDTRSSRIELNKLAEEAGKLGMQSQEDVLGFVRAADQINVALDELGEGATLTISKLTNIFGDAQRMGVEQSMLSVGSVINELSQNCTASAGYMAEFGKRMAGVGAQANMTFPQIMAFASVLDSQGQAVEMSATALSQLIMKLYKDPAKIAKAAGLEVTEFTSLLKKDANEALLVLLQRLRDLGSDDGLAVIAPIFKDMEADGARASGVLAALAKNIDMVRSQQVEANKAFQDGTSVTKEFEVQNSTVEAGLEKAKKQFFEVSAALGEKLEPIAKYTVSTFSMMIKSLNAIIGTMLEYKTVVLSGTVALGVYTMAVNWNAIATKAATVATVAWNVATKAGTFIWGVATTALLLLKGAWFAVEQSSWRARKAQLAFNAAMKANPLGLFVTAIGGVVAALMVWKKRTDEVKAKQEELFNLEKESSASYYEQAARIKSLERVVRDNNVALGERQKALDELKRIIPDYNGMLDEEGRLTRDNKEAIDDYLVSLRKEIKLKAYKDKLVQLEKSKADLEEQRDDKKKELYKEQYYTNQPLASQEGLGLKLLRALGLDTVSTLESELDDLDKDIDDTTSRIDYLMEKISEAGGEATVDGKPKKTITETPRGPSDEELRKQEKARKEADERERAALELQLANLNLLYSQGKKDYFVYQDEMYEAQKASLEKRQKIWGKETLEYAKITKELQDLETARNEGMRTASLKDMEREHQVKLAYIKASTDEDGNVRIRTEEEINEAIFQENLEFLRRKQGMYSEFSQKWYEIDVQICELQEDEKMRKHEAHQKMLTQYREQWVKKDSETQKQISLRGLEQLHTAGLVSEEEYQKMLLAIREHYEQLAYDNEAKAKDKKVNAILKKAQRAVSENDRKIGGPDLQGAGLAGDVLGILTTISNYRAMYDQIETMRQADKEHEAEYAEAKRQLNAQMFTDIAGYAQAAYNEISTIVNAASAYAQACSDYEVAKITADYDRQIEAAGNNSKRKEKLEKERDAKIRKAKTEANKKAMKIEVAQALASTAMAAINAYASAVKIPIVGPTLAPIAAAMATTAGMLQVATIKKQHQAEETGYYSGGFTDGRNYRRKAGVVHEGEFVANHLAVNNPTVRPTLELLDQAQKNNTIGRLDLPQAMGYGNTTAAVVAPTVNVQTDNKELNDAIEGMNEAIMLLHDRLAEGIDAKVYTEGEYGVAKAMEWHNKITKNL